MAIKFVNRGIAFKSRVNLSSTLQT